MIEKPSLDSIGALFKHPASHDETDLLPEQYQFFKPAPRPLCPHTMASAQRLNLRPLASGLARPSAKLQAHCLSRLPVTAVRRKSGPYGYTQAKALVFSKYGEPEDVLK